MLVDERKAQPESLVEVIVGGRKAQPESLVEAKVDEVRYSTNTNVESVCSDGRAQ